jgi:DNA-binding transcriptional ArsR family regulator
MPDLRRPLDSHVYARYVISLYGEIYHMSMREFMAITKALADEKRVRALQALQDGELCVCQITELFGLAASTISKHLSILYQAGLVDSRKDGRWIYYSLPAKERVGASPRSDSLGGQSRSPGILAGSRRRRTPQEDFSHGSR